MKSFKRILAGSITAMMLIQTIFQAAPPLHVKAETQDKNVVFDLDFDSLPQEIGEDLSGEFMAVSGQAVTPQRNVKVTEGRRGPGSKAVYLAQDAGYLTTPNTQELNPASLTTSFWLKREESVTSERRIFWAKANNDWMSKGWFVGWTPEEPMAIVTDGKDVAAYKKGTINDLLPMQEWTHFIITFDGDSGTYDFYQDGELLLNKKIPGSKIEMENKVSDLMIGKSGYGGMGLGCAIDDIQILNKALNKEEVLELFGITQEERIQKDWDSLSVTPRVSNDFKLIIKGGNGSDIKWSSDHKVIQINHDNAVVTRQSKNQDVKLTAALTMGAALSLTKEFTVTVYGTEEGEKPLQRLAWDEIIDVGGYVGDKIKSNVKTYGLETLYPAFEQPGSIDFSNHLNEFRDRNYNNWFWKGEQPGKWLESMSLSKWMRDDSIDESAEYVTNKLAEYQTKDNSAGVGYNKIGGYLGNAADVVRNTAPLKGMDPYEMYSTLHSLLETYENNVGFDDKLADTALQTAIKLADYFTATIGDETQEVTGVPGLYKKEFWPLANVNGVTIAGHGVHEGWEGSLLIDPMMRLSQLLNGTDAVRSQTYSQWVQWCIDNLDKWSGAYSGKLSYSNLDKVYAGEMGIDAVQDYVHAHTFQMNFLGFLRKYNETGDVSYLNKVEGAWNDITARQRYITGTVSVEEHYKPGYELPNSGSVCESCATNSWTLLSDSLFLDTRDPKYPQTVEDVMFNHMFATGTIDNDGYSYHRPLNGSTERFFTGPDCCSSSALRMQSYLPYYIYSKSDNEIYVNQFIESEAKIRLDGGVMHVFQETNYPQEDKIKIRIGEDSSCMGDLYVRIPQWIDSKEAVAEVDGVKVNGAATNEYLRISKNDLHPGSIIQLTFPSELRWVEGTHSNEGLWAMKKGPVVYTLDGAFISEEDSRKAFSSPNPQVGIASVLNPVDGAKVDVKGTFLLEDGNPNHHYLGEGMKVEFQTTRGVNELMVVPFANIGQWYAYGAPSPTTAYDKAERYQYVTWITGKASDYPKAPQKSNLPAVHYDFDTIDGKTVIDVSGNGKDAVLEGGAITKDGGVFGQELYLSGSNDAHVKLPNDVIYGLHDLTISSWLRPETLGVWTRVFDFGVEAGKAKPNLFLTLRNADAQMRMAFETEYSSTSVDTGLLSANLYYHVAVVIEGSTASLYVNGDKVSQNDAFNFVPYNLSDMVCNLLGKSLYKADPLYKGGMDDFRIYNHGLTDEQIKILYNKEELPLRTITSIAPLKDVVTKEGTPPVLPSMAEAVFSDGTTEKAAVTWEVIPASKYAKEGSFTVQGSIEDTEMKAIVRVIVEPLISQDQKAANEVIKMIQTIGNAAPINSKPLIDAAQKAYDVLTPAQKRLVTNKAVLDQAMIHYNKAVAQTVMNKINAIGKVTTGSKEKIDEAFKEYNGLTPQQKIYVTNIHILTSAKAAYDKLIEDEKALKALPKKGSQVKVGSYYYTVTKSASKNGTVSLRKPVKKSMAKVLVPSTIKIKGVTFKVTAISPKAFYKNTKLKSVSIGNYVTVIGAKTFYGCKKLTAVTMGKAVSTIETQAFYGDSALKNIKINSSKLKKVNKDAFKGISKRAVIKVPKNKKKAYQKLFKITGHLVCR